MECDVERADLLAEEAQLLAALESSSTAATPEAGTPAAGADAAAATRLQVVSNRLVEIGAEEAVSKAASILAGLSFDKDMQERATKTFSGGERLLCCSTTCVDWPIGFCNVAAGG